MLGCGQGRNVLETRSSSPSQGPRRCSVSVLAGRLSAHASNRTHSLSVSMSACFEEPMMLNARTLFRYLSTLTGFKLFVRITARRQRHLPMLLEDARAACRD
ncbi:hypothetical protein FOMPIDRAFT_1025696 [Fomitopsis schrenkii]|uniref:Uncharacterized protein n=1 Tax=Fomitopsis schrenkii TaxID=2126942 RepID=S8FAM7_FOMSC|nr:hypothetical protein FOMPIDRAFT_1025696 [Fomitopsis schrenkii]